MPDPHLIEVGIAAKRAIDREKLAAAVRALAETDLALGVAVDGESGQIVLKGTSEAHLERSIESLYRAHGIVFEIGAPQVAYRETLTRRVETDYTHKKLSGGVGEFARVKLVCEPSKTGGFVSKAVGGAVPDAYLAGVEKGIAEAMQSGILAGFPVIDVRVTLLDGAYHDTDSSAHTFEIASRAAFRQALHEGGSILLEPVMSVEVTIPEDSLGFVTGDLRARRGRIQNRKMRGDTISIEALVPFANTLGYANQLRSGTQDRGTYEMRFSRYEPLPDPDGDGPSAPAVALRA